MVCLMACALYTFDVLLALNNVRDKTFFFTNHKTQTAALIFFLSPRSDTSLHCKATDS